MNIHASGKWPLANSSSGTSRTAADPARYRSSNSSRDAAKGVNRRADQEIYETTLLKHMPPACARQATGNSVGPQVDVAERPCQDLLAVRDSGELQTSAGPQHPHNLREDLALVSAKVNDVIRGIHRRAARFLAV
jgi:hypothetical protein